MNSEITGPAAAAVRPDKSIEARTETKRIKRECTSVGALVLPKLRGCDLGFLGEPIVYFQRFSAGVGRLRPYEFPLISDDFRWRFSGAVRKNDNRRTRTHAPSGVNLNTSVNMPAAERPRGGKPRGLTL